MVVFDTDKCPNVLVVVIIDAVHQVEDDVGVVGFWKSVLVKSDACRRRHFSEDIVIIEENLVIVGFGGLGRVRKRRAKTAFRIAFFTGRQLQFADGRHY